MQNHKIKSKKIKDLKFVMSCALLKKITHFVKHFFYFYPIKNCHANLKTWCIYLNLVIFENVD